MNTRDLLARLTLALTATSFPLAACGGETTDGNAGNTSAQGGNATAGTGGSTTTAGSAGTGGGTTAGTGGGTTAGTGGGTTAGTGGSTTTAGTGGGTTAGTGGGTTAGTGGTGGSVGGAAGAPQGGNGGAGATCNRPLPATGGQGFGPACRVATDCNDGPASQCLRPDESLCPFGGGAPEPTCVDDASCGGIAGGAKYVCQAFESGGASCQQACVDDTICGASQRCDVATGHCVQRDCPAAPAACPTDTFCGADGKCAFQRCNAARPCATGETCSSTTFTCEPQTCDVNVKTSCPDTFTCVPLSSKPVEICVRTTCTCDTECGASGFCLGGTCYENAGTCTGGVACGRPLLTDEGPRVARLVLGLAHGWNQ